jgi:tetratricopeptide (TPR) repeat protein
MPDWMNLFRGSKTEAGGGLAQINMLTMEGRAAIAMGRPVEGLQFLREKHGLILARFGNDTVFSATSAVDLGEALSACGEVAEAGELLTWAIARYQALEVDDERLDQALTASAMASYAASDYVRAEKLFLSVISRAESRGPQANQERAAALDHLAQLHTRQGLHERGRELALQALAIFETEDPGGIDTAICLGMLASADFHLNRYRDAEMQNRRALAIFEAQGQELHAAKTLDHLAAALCLRAQSESDRGLAAQAIGHSERALEIFQRLLPPNHRSLDVCRMTLADAKAIHASVGMMYPSAQNDEAPLVAEIPDGHPDRLRVLLARCEAEQQARRYDDALGTVRGARALADRNFGARSQWAKQAFRREIGVLRRRCTYLLGEPTGNLSPAEAMTMQLCAHARRGLAEDETTPREGLDELDAATRRQVVEVLGEALLMIDAPWTDTNFQSDYLEIVHYARQLSLLTGPQACARAAEVMQRDSESAAAAYLDLALSRLQETAEQRRLRDEYRFAVAELDAHHRLLVAAAVKGETSARARLDLVEGDVAAARARLLAAGCDPEPTEANAVALEAITEKLDSDEAIALYHLGSRAIFIVGLTAADMTFVRVEYEQGLVEDLCRRVVESASLSPGQALGSFDLPFALHLHDLLIDPLMPKLRDVRRLMVAPHSDLWALPFASLIVTPLGSLFEDGSDVEDDEAEPFGASNAARRKARIVRMGAYARSLRTPTEGARAVSIAGAWLGDRFEISILPTLSPLVSRGRALAAPRGGFLGIGDPDLPPGLGLEEVPETQRLLRSLAKSLGGDAERDLLLRRAASVDRLLELSETGVLAQKRVLCFATHAVYPKEDGDLLIEPGLVMSRGEVLRASDVAALSLDADLVLLTACYTGAPSGARITEPLSGLAQAFFAAGARALLISHWPVDVTATEIMVARMFAAGGDAGETLSGALKRAAADLRRSANLSEAYCHPAFWAGFSIVGDPARLS